MMNDHADEAWFGCKEVFRQNGTPTPQVIFPKQKTWKRYVNSRRLEIACGEAPYLVSRYDVETGETIPISERIGLLDRKLRVVGENTTDEAEWLAWVVGAFWSIYGFEFQGDNVLIARVNLLMTFEEYLWDRWKRKPTEKEYEKFTHIITWNIWQMDGLKRTISYSTAAEEFQQYSLFCPLETETQFELGDKQPSCRIMNWLDNRSVKYSALSEKGKHGMKFDFIIGNPPYQEEAPGTSTSDKPIYHLFMDSVYDISDKGELITPARFLFDAGATPSAWNHKMLSDYHFKVIYYEVDSSTIFSNTSIIGGIAITYRDAGMDYGAIGKFTAFPELNSILKKITPFLGISGSLVEIIRTQNKFNLDVLNASIPGLRVYPKIRFIFVNVVDCPGKFGANERKLQFSPPHQDAHFNFGIGSESS